MKIFDGGLVFIQRLLLKPKSVIKCRARVKLDFIDAVRFGKAK